MSQGNGAPAKPVKPVKAQAQGNKEAPDVSQCKSEGCKSKPAKFGFCLEHYDLYMAGVIRGDGKKPIDYEEKLALHLRNKKGAAKAA